MEQIQVPIVVAGRTYTISADADQSRLWGAVQRVNESIDKYKNRQWSDELRATALTAVVFAHDLSEYEERVTVAESAVKRAQEQYQAIHDAMENKRNQQIEALREAAQLREKQRTVDFEHQQLQDKIAQLEMQLVQQQEQFDLTELELMDHGEQQEQRIAEILGTHETEKNQWHEQYASLEQERDSLLSELKQRKSREETLRDALHQANEEKKNLRDTLQDQQKYFKDLQNQIEVERARMDSDLLEQLEITERLEKQLALKTADEDLLTEKVVHFESEREIVESTVKMMLEKMTIMEMNME